jgi:hypothetical protein
VRRQEKGANDEGMVGRKKRKGVAKDFSEIS